MQIIIKSLNTWNSSYKRNPQSDICLKQNFLLYICSKYLDFWSKLIRKERKKYEHTLGLKIDEPRSFNPKHSPYSFRPSKSNVSTTVLLISATRQLTSTSKSWNKQDILMSSMYKFTTYLLEKETTRRIISIQSKLGTCRNNPPATPIHPTGRKPVN